LFLNPQEEAAMRIWMRCVLTVVIVAVAPTLTGVVAQEYDDAPDGCCWIHFWNEAGFMGDDDIIYGPGEWPDATDWETQVGSLKVGECATVNVWTEEQFEGESHSFKAGAQLTDFAASYVNSMKMSCDG